MEGSAIRYLVIFLFLASCIFAQDKLSLENNTTMELIKAYVDDSNDSEDVVKKALNPTKEDYMACKAKSDKAYLKISGVDGVAIDKEHVISFSKPISYQVYDPFYDFYMIKSNKTLPFISQGKSDDCQESSYVGVVGKSSVQFGTIVQKGDEVSTLDFKTQKGNLVLSPCCKLLGISLGEKEFLNLKYLKQTKQRTVPYDGYIGASFSQKHNGVVVKNIDPFLEKLNFCPMDKILTVDGEKISSIHRLNRLVLSAKIGSMLDITIQRAGKEKHFLSKVLKKPDYELSSLIFLESLGFNFNENLTVTNIDKDSFAHKSGLKSGDKLLQINFKDIKSLNEIRDIFIYDKKKKFNLLFTRDNFQFFVKLNKKDIKGGLIELSHCPRF